MNYDLLTMDASRAGRRYSLLMASFQSVYDQNAIRFGIGSSKTQTRAYTEAYQFADPFLHEEAMVIDHAVAREREHALRFTLKALNQPIAPADDALIDHTNLIAQELKNTLNLQVSRDVKNIGRMLRLTALRVSLVAGTTGSLRRDALVSLRPPEAAQPGFQYIDRAGRRWPSPLLVQTVWRHALVMAWNETAMLTMAKLGVKSAMIDHADASLPYGVVISLSEEEGQIGWDDVREDVFHPNSNSWLVPELES